MRKLLSAAFAMALVTSAAAAQTAKYGTPNSHVPYIGAIQVPSSTAAQLPACDSYNQGIVRMVTDATTPTYNGTLTGGSNVPVLVVCNGTTWKTM